MVGEFQAKRILIVNDHRDLGHSYSPLFSEFGEVTNDIAAFMLNPYHFKLIQFTGGADVTPSYYGDTSPKGLCGCNTARDEEEEKVFWKAYKTGVKMAGICRGLQFINVMAGGKLMHHIDGHSGESHMVSTSQSPSFYFQVNSAHHQMVIPPNDAFIISWTATKLSDVYIGDKDEETDWYGPEIEGLYIPGFRAVGVQWHPEALGETFHGRKFYTELLKDYLEKTVTEFRNKYTGVKNVSIEASV